MDDRTLIGRASHRARGRFSCGILVRCGLRILHIRLIPELTLQPKTRAALNAFCARTTP
ncbi:MAG: hypothetical protein GXP31_05840 [Kiritimatiellaeota bacterium]|nr:hypothetical protein [Kiritimatiellota bacterium]